MKYYCAGCGREFGVGEVVMNKGPLGYHRACTPKEIPDAHVPAGKGVRHISDNRIESEMRDLSAMMDMINNPQPRIVRIK